jgi:hypothetical protein
LFGPELVHSGGFDFLGEAEFLRAVVFGHGLPALFSVFHENLRVERRNRVLHVKRGLFACGWRGDLGRRLCAWLLRVGVGLVCVHQRPFCPRLPLAKRAQLFGRRHDRIAALCGTMRLTIGDHHRWLRNRTRRTRAHGKAGNSSAELEFQ